MRIALAIGVGLQRRNILTDVRVCIRALVVGLDGRRQRRRCCQRRRVDDHLQRSAGIRKLQQTVKCIHVIRHIALTGDFHTRIRVRLKQRDQLCRSAVQLCPDAELVQRVARHQRGHL